MIRRPVIASLLAIAATALLVGGCAQQPAAWQKPGASQEQWTADTTYCRSWARRRAERDYSAYSNPQGSAGIQSGIGFDNLMRRHDAKRNTVALFEDCLKRKGYRKAPPPADKS